MLDGAPPLIDAISSWWVTLHGHANPSIAAAIATQAQQLEQVIFMPVDSYSDLQPKKTS